MARFSRRRFLRDGSLAGLALTGCAGEETSAAPGPWAEARGAHREALLPEDKTPRSMLELFIWGGLSPWESFYVVPEHGDPEAGGPYAGQQWWTFQEGEHTIHDALAPCAFERELLQPFARAHDGKEVRLGPFAWPLRDRPDLLARTRIFVLRHDQLPHQGATPLALGGQLRGSRRLAGIGAHVERFFQDRLTTARSTPHSYVLIPDEAQAATDNIEAVAAVGLHRGSARPLSIRLRGDATLHERLLRPALGARAPAVDEALRWYQARYANRLRFRGEGDPLPSAALEDLVFARDVLSRSDRLAAALPPEVLEAVAGELCGNRNPRDPSGMGMQLAAHLLTRSEEPARYVTLVDGGLLNWGVDAPHDTHTLHIEQAAVNVPHALKNLADRIREPGDDDPSKIDLDETGVLVTTEFGRTPYLQPDTDGGTDHWPYGYVVLAIGGVVDEERAGVVGAIGEDGYATAGVTPQEFRAAMLLGQGIWPFTNESFAVGDVRDADSELDAAMILKRVVLGYDRA